MKILFVTRENEADRRYGLGKSLMPLVRELERRGHAVGYLSRSDWGRRGERFLLRLHACIAALASRLAPRATTNFAAIGWAMLERLNTGRLAAKVAARDRYTHVHLHDPWLALGFRIFSAFAGRDRAHWGISQHGFGCYAHAVHVDGGPQGPAVMRWLRRLEARTLRAADWVVFPTTGAREQCARDLCIHPVPGNWYRIYHARPDVQLYERGAARRQLGWDERAVCVLGVGRLVPLKGFERLIEACARLSVAAPVQLAILGDGDTTSLRRHAQALMPARAVMFGTTDDIGLYLCASDVYVSTSTTESFGMSNLEALVAGTPAICTAVGGVPEVTGNGALLVPPCVDVLAQSLQQVLEDAGLRAMLVRNGRARAAAWPGIEETTDAYERVYRAAAPA
jgi:glycosyltransferase involved in cell wall biosynthesis